MIYLYKQISSIEATKILYNKSKMTSLSHHNLLLLSTLSSQPSLDSENSTSTPGPRHDDENFSQNKLISTFSRFLVLLRDAIYVRLLVSLGLCRMLCMCGFISTPVNIFFHFYYPLFFIVFPSP